jgi:hypothetical protein
MSEISDPIESTLYDILRVLRDLDIDITNLNVAYMRNKVTHHYINYPDSSQYRRVIELSAEFNDAYGKSINLLTSKRNIASIDVSFFNSINPYDFIAIVNPANLYKKAYVALDGNKGTVSADQKKISWNINALTNYDGTQIKNKFRDIVSIKLLSYLIPINIANVTSTQITTVLIEELTSQCYISPDRKYHFISYDKLTNAEIIRISQVIGFMYNPVIRKMTIDNSCHDGIYHFNPPITLLDTITLSFGRPTILCSIAGQSIFQRCFINLEVTYLDPAYLTET